MFGPLLTMLLAYLADTEDSGRRSGRLYELRNRLTKRDTDPRLHPRLAGIREQYGPQILKRVQAILVHQKLPANRVKKLLPWLARQVSQSLDLGPADWPDLELMGLWQEVTRLDMGVVSIEHVRPLLGAWYDEVRSAVNRIYEEQGLTEGSFAFERAEVLMPWVFSRTARGDNGPWPELLWISDWVDGEDVAPQTLANMSSATASGLSAQWHGQEEISGSDEEVWAAWHNRVQEAKQAGWKPRPGRIVRSWPNGYTMQSLESSFRQLQDETRIMDHCVGRESHGRRYWRGIQAGRIQIWSLRNAEGYPLVTLEAELRGGEPVGFSQIYAPRNSPVHPAHMGYIFDALGPYLDRLPSSVQDRFIAYITGEHHPSFQWVLESPRMSLKWAQHHGPGDGTRATASRSADEALTYAAEVDRGPHDVTRAGFISGLATEVGGYRGPLYRIQRWLSLVEPAGHPDLLRVAVSRGTSQDLEQYVEKAGIHPSDPMVRRFILESGGADTLLWLGEKEGPRADTRTSSTRDPFLATAYALLVDKGPSDETWKAALLDPFASVIYDAKVLDSATDAGRSSASRQANAAVAYAKGVDEGVHADTLAGVLSAPVLERTDQPFHMFGEPLSDYGPLYEALDFANLFGGRERWNRVALLRYDRSPLLESYPRPGEKLLPEVSSKLLALANPGVLGRVGAKHPELVRRPGTERLWTTPEVVYEMLRQHELSQESREVMAALIASRPALRKRAISSPRSAFVVAKYIDGRPSASTLNQVLSDGSELKKYVKELVDDPSRLPPKARRALALHGQTMSSEMGFRSYRASSGGGWGRGGREDYVQRMSGQVLRETVAFAARDLTRRYRKKSRAEQRKLNAAVVQMQRWAEGGGSSPPESFMLIARRYYPDFLEWLDQDFWDAWSGVSPSTPLASVIDMSSDDIPRVVYLGQLGRGGDDNWIYAPPFSAQGMWEGGRGMKINADVLRGHAQPDNRAGAAIWEWWSALPRREKGYVSRRLGIEREASREELFDAVSVIWGAATPIDAERQSRSDMFHEIHLNETPLLWVMPWTTPGRDVGWILIYPSYDAQIPPKARDEALVRMVAQ